MLFRWRPAAWWIWPIAVGAVLALQVWFPRLDTGVLHDSYSASAEGQRAFFRLIGTQTYVYRSVEPLTRWLPYDDGEQTLCILGPARWPTAPEWDALLDWVSRGGRLVFACRTFEEKSIPQLDVRFVPRDPSVPPDDSLPPETDLTRAKEIAWWTDGQLLAPGRESLVKYAGQVQAVVLPHGAGRVVVIATPHVFSNQLLTYGENVVLAYRLVEAAGPLEYVMIDESLNDSGTAKAMGVLLDPALRPLTLQLVLLLFLYGWWNCRRYGPLARATGAARHNLVDHTDTVGASYWRTNSGAAVLRSYLRSLRDELRLGAAPAAETALVAIAARRLNRTIASVQDDVQAAQRAAKAKSLDRRIAARMITRLAVLRRALSDQR
jgi:hypothetical protein